MRKTTSSEATKQLAATLAPYLQAGDVIVLSGDLGAGKTQFVQGVASGLGAVSYTQLDVYKRQGQVHRLSQLRAGLPVRRGGNRNRKAAARTGSRVRHRGCGGFRSG